MSQSYKKKNGFTILEITVVMFIITLGLVGVMSLVIQNFQVSYINKNELIASQLAQEGLELVRNQRDENWLDDDRDWKVGSGQGTQSDIVQDLNYTIDYTGTIDGNIDSINDAGANLGIDVDDFYQHGGSSASIFYRLIEIVDGTYIEVKCTVRWKERGKTHDYTASTLLYDWK